MELDGITSFDNYAVLFSPVAFVRSVLFFFFVFFFGGGADLSRGGAKNENNKKRSHYSQGYLRRCLGRECSSTANILDTNTITGELSEELQAWKSVEK